MARSQYTTTGPEARTATPEVLSAVGFCGHSWGLDIKAASWEYTAAKGPAEEGTGNVVGKWRVVWDWGAGGGMEVWISEVVDGVYGWAWGV